MSREIIKTTPYSLPINSLKPASYASTAFLQIDAVKIIKTTPYYLQIFNPGGKMGPIQVKCSCGEEKCPEWAIIEVQGVVEVKPELQNNLQNLEIGRLCRPSSQETYTFTIGYHELTGSRVKLKKPLVVLKKVKHSNEDQETNTNSSSTVELDVIGVIRQKILFKTRPKALITVAKKT